ncbi:MAG: helix-turn-helix domain-containing protein [Candidatus Falkowbacteria bacterium]|nr:helix-turn-helix domain-containing protein [Candidatus Falkowbacteria bacterium]
MHHSVLKDISNVDGPGLKLKNARENLGWKITDAAKKTGISIAYLKALEEERFDQIPSGLYAAKYFKKYSKALKITLDKDYPDFFEGQVANKSQGPFEKKILDRRQLISFPKILRRISLVLVIFLCVLYLLLYFKKMFFPPSLIIYYPEKNLISREQSITVSGRVEAESDLKINDETIPKDKQNNFSQKISLKKGINNITIKAKKKYSREKVITRQILVE